MKVIGGLGNQMFQYAAGRALSLKHQVPLKLDLSGFGNYALHQGFELDRVFVGPFEPATPSEMRRVLGWRAPRTLRRVLSRRRAAGLRGTRFIVEPQFHYWPGIADVPPDAYLAGYWQSERYFAGFAQEIRTSFGFKPPMSEANRALARRIDGCEMVSLHVRRGDYVADATTHANHGVCSLDYYRAAVRRVAERVAHAEFLIFSDDIAWTKGNLSLDAPCHYVDHNLGIESYNDMRLMSLCRHHILANSTFSWWAAWLNPRPDKIVIAPKRWFASDLDASDVIPSAWERI